MKIATVALALGIFGLTKVMSSKRKAPAADITPLPLESAPVQQTI